MTGLPFGLSRRALHTGLFVLTLGVILSVGWSVGADATEARTLVGEYNWTGGGATGELEAVFGPTGADTWDVDFKFVFDGQSHTYTGTANGSLGEGELSGTVKTENGRRTFTFKGRFEAGSFVGEHFERGRKTGTLTLQ